MYLRGTQTFIIHLGFGGGLLLPVTVEQISLQQGSTLLLAGPIVFRFIFVVSITEFVNTFHRPDDTRS